MTKAWLFIGGTVFWLTMHRYVWVYMGEATLLTLLAGLLGMMLRGMYEVRRDDYPNFHGDARPVWTGWHLVTWMAGGIILEGTTRFMA
jgi:hypothetical protein